MQFRHSLVYLPETLASQNSIHFAGFPLFAPSLPTVACARIAPLYVPLAHRMHTPLTPVRRAVVSEPGRRGNQHSGQVPCKWEHLRPTRRTRVPRNPRGYDS